MNESITQSEDRKKRKTALTKLTDLSLSLSLSPPVSVSSFLDLKQEHRWKAGARLRTGPGLQLKIQRAIALPNCLGLGLPSPPPLLSVRRL